MSRLAFMCLNAFKARTLPSSRLLLRPAIQQSCKRYIAFELPDEENESLVRQGDFEVNYPKLRIPYKLSHPKQQERSKQFIKLRLEEYPNGMKPLNVQEYSQLFDSLENDEKREKMVNDISLLLHYYNGILSKSIFCPSTIPLADMEKMLNDYASFRERIRYIHFLFVREFDQWRNELEAGERRQKRQQEEAEELASFTEIGCFDRESGQLQYGYWRNTLFTRYFEAAKDKYSLHNLRQAQLFGQPIVLDCSFDETMADYETISVARQIASIYNANRFNSDPFRLLFCGVSQANRGYQHTVKQLHAVIRDPAYFFNLHSETYQEMLPGSRFIYLSPDAPTVMEKFDLNAVYIIGALVSKTHKSSFTYEKALSEGIETVRLPIEQYVTLKLGVKKVLSFQGVFKILLELRRHGDWERALRNGILEHKLVPKEESGQ